MILIHRDGGDFGRVRGARRGWCISIVTDVVQQAALKPDLCLQLAARCQILRFQLGDELRDGAYRGNGADTLP